MTEAIRSWMSGPWLEAVRNTRSLTLVLWAGLALLTMLLFVFVGMILSRYVKLMYVGGLNRVAGGLFAHVIRYINPGTFGIQKLAEILAMVYFGGLNSVTGSIVGAVSINILMQ